jgi:hypothetical protein
MPLVAGVDSSTQSCKIVIRDAQTRQLVRQGSARHPEGTEVDPEAWWTALQAAVQAAGGIDDVAAVSVAGQQHGMGAAAERLILVGGGARSAAVQHAAAGIFTFPSSSPSRGSTTPAAQPDPGLLLGNFPPWQATGSFELPADPAPDVLERYRSAAALQITKIESVSPKSASAL